MKCEICNEKDAETAIVREDGGEAHELYVCRECAGRERAARQKKRERTRKAKSAAPANEGEGGDNAPPPIIAALMNAMSDIVTDLENIAKEKSRNKPEAGELVHFDSAEIGKPAFRLRGDYHLEALFLIGEIGAVRRAVNALGMKLEGLSCDGISDAGHIYGLYHPQGEHEKAERVVRDILEQEHNARVRLVEEMPRVFGDTVYRSLAILKNCRLLSPGEYLDLLSPLRLACIEKMLDGISRREIEKVATGLKMREGMEDSAYDAERDRQDAERADEVNARFENVVVNERGEECFESGRGG